MGLIYIFPTKWPKHIHGMMIHYPWLVKFKQPLLKGGLVILPLPILWDSRTTCSKTSLATCFPQHFPRVNWNNREHGETPFGK